MKVVIKEKNKILVEIPIDKSKSFADQIVEAYQQGRADAIEEFADILINPNNYERYDFDDCINDSNKANDFFKYVFDMAEQLKEQNEIP